MTEPQTADPGTSATPGSDWEDVPEGVGYTAEQAARKFLDLPWEEQVARMDRFLDDSAAAAACQMLNHEGAHIFATQHSCQTDRFQEGWEQGWKDACDELEKRMAALGN